MDLGLTKRGDYAVRAAIALGRSYAGGGWRKIREVAADVGIPLAYTPQILNLLAKAGLVEARAGQRGGYRLLRKPAEISLLEVVEAAEGPLAADRCTLRGGPCAWDQMCPLHPVWQESRQALVDVLARTPLASLLEVDAALEAGSYPVPETSHRATRPG